MDYLTISYLSNNIFSLFDLYLLQRQNRAYRCTTIPPTLAHSIDPTTFQQGQDYGRAKTQHLIWTSIKKIVESNVVLMSSWSVKLWKWSVLPAVYQQGSFAHCAAFCALGEVVNTLLDLPQDYYFHFVVEEKFGFNKLSVREWIKDHVKSFLLKTCVLQPIVVALINFVVQYFGKSFPLYLFGGSTAVVTAFTFLFPVLIQPLFNKFTPINESHYGELFSEIKALTKRVHFPLYKTYEVDGSRRSAHSNAYFYGFLWAKRIVLFDTLLTTLSKEEILAVLSHELGHWKHNHTTGLYVMQLGIFGMFSYLLRRSIFDPKLYTDFGFPAGVQYPGFLGALLFSNALFDPLMKVVMYAMCFLSRMFEFQADRYVVDLGYGVQLRKGLLTMQKENKMALTPDWLFAALNYSHPPLVQRITTIDELLKRRE